MDHKDMRGKAGEVMAGGELHSLAPARLALMGRLRRCVASVNSWNCRSWLSIEECFCQTNPTEKRGSIVE